VTTLHWPEVSDEEDLVRHKEDRLRLRAQNLGLTQKMDVALGLLQEAYDSLHPDDPVAKQIKLFLDGYDVGLRWSDVKQAAREP
jgi:hypothetical protein